MAPLISPSADILLSKKATTNRIPFSMPRHSRRRTNGTSATAPSYCVTVASESWTTAAVVAPRNATAEKCSDSPTYTSTTMARSRMAVYSIQSRLRTPSS